MADGTEKEVGAGGTEEESLYLEDFDRGYKARAEDKPFDESQGKHGKKAGRKLT